MEAVVMKRNFSRVVAVLAPALVFCAGAARGENASSYYAGSSEGRYLSVTDSKQMLNGEAATSPAKGGSTCNGGCDTGCDSCCDSCCDELDAFCEECPRSTTILFTNFESFRGITDGSFQNNNGVRTGFNYGALVGERLGFQTGVSYGAYDFMGRQSSAPFELNTVQEQYFVTTGFFRRADCESPWSAGLVYDWMINDNFGILSNEPFLGQWRGQLAYATSAWNEFGVWGTVRDRGDSQTNLGFGVPTQYRAAQQYNTFWHHKWECSVDSWVWLGAFDNSDDLSPGNGWGEWTLGGRVVAPISESWAITGDLQYVKPSASAGPAGAQEDAFFVSVGLSYYPRCNARSRTVAGTCSSPLLDVANNGSFLVDTNVVF